MNTAKKWMEKLSLEPHPEGGFFKETYRSSDKGQFDSFNGIRNVSTAIYFMLTRGNFSAFHRIKSDEMWHFYDGSPIAIYVIDEVGHLEKLLLGTDMDAGQFPQHVVQAGCWFASCVEGKGNYSLVGCMVAPGFDFNDFEMARCDELVSEFPQHEGIIKTLTRQNV